MGKKSVGLVYLCIHRRLLDRCDRFKMIKRKELFSIFGRVYHLPKKLHYPVLREMMNMKLLSFPNKKFVKVLSAPQDLDNTGKIYKKLGFF